MTCTITNTDNTPTLKLVKVVTNNDGGTATAADFTLSAVSAGADASRNFTSATATPSFHSVFGATVYNLSESGPAGYTAARGVVTPAPSRVRRSRCRLVARSRARSRTRQHADVEVGQVVTNNDGGTATAADFTLSAVSAGVGRVAGLHVGDGDARRSTTSSARRSTTCRSPARPVTRRARGVATVAPSRVRRSRCRSVARSRARSRTRTTRRR